MDGRVLDGSDQYIIENESALLTGFTRIFTLHKGDVKTASVQTFRCSRIELFRQDLN